jgi:IS605 OrfB family transposase
MNRIYQGRVTKVEVPDGNGGWKPLDDDPKKAKEKWQAALWRHHELFQDAVNYYTVCLLALASSEVNPLTKIRRRIEDTAATPDAEHHVWTKVRRKGAVRPGLRQSVAKYLTPENNLSTPEECFAAVLKGNNTEAEILDDGLMMMLAECTDKEEGAIKEIGRSYYPRFCDPSYSGNFTGDSLMQERENSKLRLPAILYHPDTKWDSTSLKEFDVYAIATPDNRNPVITGDEAKQRLLKAVDHWETLRPAHLPEFEKLRETIRTLPPELAIPRYVGSSAKGGVQSRLFALLLFRYVNPCQFTFELLKGSFPPVTDFSILTKPLVQSRAMDPIRTVRGTRGYVFQAFSTLPIWAVPHNKNEASLLKQFDITAFKYALTTLHQIETKAKEREEKKKKIDARLLAMRDADARANWKISAESESDDRPPLLAGDERISRLETVLKSLPVVQDLCDVEGQPPEYGLLPRTIRGFEELSTQWNKLKEIREAASPSAELRDKVLIPKLNQFQKENPETVGSVALFRALAEPENWIMWKTPDKLTQTQWTAAGFADDPLEALTEERELKAESERLKEPIRFTPADPVYSRRQFFFSDACSFPGKEYFHESNALRAIVPLVMLDSDGKLSPRRVRINYAAPRLLRDGLRRQEEEVLDKVPWSQPMMQALGLGQEATQDLSDCAIALMPEQNSAGERRFLLSFPLMLDPLAVQRMVFKAADRDALFSTRYDKRAKKHVLVSYWEQQCARTDGKLFYLRWPSNKWPAGKESDAWYHRVSGFQCLSVDLGQRDAGAWALLEAKDSTDFGLTNKRTPVPSRRIGNANGKTWHAAVRATGMFKLPGEDADVYRPRSPLDDLKSADNAPGKAVREELYGERGRSATPDEWKDTIAMCERFGFDPNLVLGSKEDVKSYPELNDDLLFVLKRAQSRLARWQRWSWMVQDQTRQEKVLAEIIEGNDTPKAWADVGNQIPVLVEEIKSGILNLRDSLCSELEFIANRILPLRGRKWEWVTREDLPNCRILRETEDGTDTAKKKLYGQRGLSLKRIQQLAELRRRCQSLNRALQHKPGERPKDGASQRGVELPDPCPDLLDKMDHIKKQRVHQLAHEILAQALGVRLRVHQVPDDIRREQDLHGEYERIPRRKPVDFIVIEDLEFYATTQRRAKSENTKLMLWSRRELRKKLIELCDTYGLRVIEASPDYTSKFDARTGGPGFRATEVTPDSKRKPRWHKMLERWRRHLAGEKISDRQSADEHERVAQLFELLDAANKDRRSTDKRNPWRTLYVPQYGGNLFISAAGNGGPVQADINAAINLGLRAIAAPDCHEIHWRIRLDREVEDYRPRRKSKREEARWKSTPKNAMFVFNKQPPTDLKDAFVDILNVADYDHCRLDGLSLRLAGGRGFWDTVNKMEWNRCMALNAVRLNKWGLRPPKDWVNTLKLKRRDEDNDITF